MQKQCVVKMRRVRARSKNLKDCYGIITELQGPEHSELLEAFVLGGINWWMFFREELTRNFTAYRSLVYRRLFQNRSHDNPLAVPSARSLAVHELVVERLTAQVSIVGEQPLFAGIDRESAPCRPWMLYNLYRDHNTYVESKAFSRVADGWLRALDMEACSWKCCPLEQAALGCSYWKAPFFISIDMPRAQASVRWEGEDTFMRVFSEICSRVAAAGWVLLTDRVSFLSRVRSCLHASVAWEQVFRHFGTRYLALSSFFTEDRFALLIAAKRCGVQTIDIQHGWMGPYSAYAQLGGIPQAAAGFLPEIFWTWGETSAAELQQSLGKYYGRRSSVVIGGSATRDPSFAEDGSAVDCDAGMQLLDQVKESACGVLVVHQPDLQVQGDTPCLLPEHVWQVMAQCGPDFCWLLRLHPRSRHLERLFANQFRRRGIARWEVHFSSRLPVNRLLPFIDKVATSFSTLGPELNDHGIPFLVIDEFGAQMMKSIHPPLAYLATTQQTFRAALQESYRFTPSESRFAEPISPRFSKQGWVEQVLPKAAI
jgi:hypothetical protein